MKCDLEVNTNCEFYVWLNKLLNLTLDLDSYQLFS